jgi:multidrug efflux pump subunit AcrB
MAAQDISFPAMRDKQRLLAQMTLDDPAVRTVTAFAGGGRNSNNVGFMFIALKPLAERPGRVTADQVVNRLRGRLSSVPGATLFLQAFQELQVGGRGSAAQYQYTLSDENLNELNTWAPRLEARAKTMPELRDVSTDQQDQGLAANLVIDRDAASRLGITASAIDNVLYDAFGQREVSTMYTALNQYFVVMEVDPQYQLSPDSLNGIFIKANNVVGATTAMPATVTATAAAASPTAAPVTSAPPATPMTLTAVTLPTAAAIIGPPTNTNITIPPLTTPVPSTISAPASTAIVSAITSPTAAGAAPAVSAPTSSTSGAMVPLSAIARYEQQRTSLAVNHQGQYPAVTLTFNLAPNVALGDAVTALEKVQAEMGMPSAIHATFQGSAQAFQDSLKNEKWLILAALVAVYIVLGILYESLIHPLTILSTLPPAGVGAILALLLTRTDLSIIALIGIILLIGIVKKNAIMMIDFALQAERDQGLPPVEAIYQACLLRFRPIMMTTMAALFGGLPLAIGMGVGSELRKPLGITIVGGLIVSQMLTLFTTPVVYLFFDRLQWRVMKLRRIGAEMEEAPGD